MKKRFQLVAVLLSLFTSCQTATEQREKENVGTVEFSTEEMKALFAEDTQVEFLAEGFSWAEGPLWLEESNRLIFTDVPQNKIHQWSEANGLSLYLEGAGYKSQETLKGSNLGANGLQLNEKGQLVMCQHGGRQVAVLESSLETPEANFTSLAGSYEGKSLNSPNDLIFDKLGNLYFTDPPYGLEGRDVQKDLPFNGVYKLDTEDQLILLDSTLTRPNGVGISTDGKTLYVANSDPKKSIWMAYDITETGVENARLFYDATEWVGEKYKGLPDGLKVHSSGNIFATGPGGVWVFSPEGKVVGKISTPMPVANCAFDTKEEYIYLTANDKLLRVKLK
ncbi:SMP-30/gluconolactonase/LRE family protein [Sediminitomix flava]|uniref:Gluconolactonase n=1 Tax=Sediminitomix flava TaxID=379075 RepID=A0A315Z0S8_SEDFL|nr:SMP-30/gluconolactonase/LRE family protein [Sediminitomix flava]PWJ36162.1 gluconolactonase [Sediminitomix flava]